MLCMNLMGTLSQKHNRYMKNIMKQAKTNFKESDPSWGKIERQKETEKDVQENIKQVAKLQKMYVPINNHFKCKQIALILI